MSASKTEEVDPQSQEGEEMKQEEQVTITDHQADASEMIDNTETQKMDEDMDDAPQGEVNSPKSIRSQRQVPDETNSAFGL
jgi:hypothetical protein